MKTVLHTDSASITWNVTFPQIKKGATCTLVASLSWSVIWKRSSELSIIFSFSFFSYFLISPTEWVNNSRVILWAIHKSRGTQAFPRSQGFKFAKMSRLARRKLCAYVIRRTLHLHDSLFPHTSFTYFTCYPV